MSNNRTSQAWSLICLLSMALLFGSRNGYALHSRPQAQPAVSAKFDVTSVKRNASGEGRFGIFRQPGGRFLATNVTVKMLMSFAWRLPDSQISGGPGWIASDRFDVEGKSGAVARMISAEQIAPMVQSLLEDRFQMRTHTDKRDFPVYELVIAKNGLKMKKSPDQGPPDPSAPANSAAGPGPRGSLVGRASGLIGNAISVGPLVNQLSRLLGKPVIDKTGLKELFDFTLQWTPDSVQAAPNPPQLEPGEQPPDPNGPSIFTAIQEQLGLKLEATKAPVDVLVIDSIEKPSEN